MEDFDFSVPASLARLAALLDYTKLQRPLIFDIVFRTAYFILDSRSVYVGAPPATSLFVELREYWFLADDTGRFLSVRFAIAERTAKDAPFRYLYRSSVYRLSA